jgi:hypothetical protein
MEIPMKTLSSLAALSLSFVLALTPFALIALDDAAAKGDVSTVAATSASSHASGVEGR